MKTSLPESPAANREHGHTARAAFLAIMASFTRSQTAGRSFVEVHMIDGQIEYVEVSPRRASATPRRSVGRVWQAVVEAIRRNLTLQEPSHMPARAYVPVRVTSARRTRP